MTTRCNTRYIETLLYKLFPFCSIAGHIVRCAIYLIMFFMGLWVAGPFLTSAAYRTIIEQAAGNPLLGYILDPSDWIFNKLIKNFALLFAVWAWAFAKYHKSKGDVKELNAYLGYVSFLTRGLEIFLVSLFMFFSGIGVYSLLILNEVAVGVITVFNGLIGFGLPGLFFSYYARLSFKPNPLLDIAAPRLAVLCGAISMVAFLFIFFRKYFGLTFFLFSCILPIDFIPLAQHFQCRY